MKEHQKNKVTRIFNTYYKEYMKIPSFFIELFNQIDQMDLKSRKPVLESIKLDIGKKSMPKDLLGILLSVLILGGYIAIHIVIIAYLGIVFYLSTLAFLVMAGIIVKIDTLGLGLLVKATSFAASIPDKEAFIKVKIIDAFIQNINLNENDVDTIIDGLEEIGQSIKKKEQQLHNEGTV